MTVAARQARDAGAGGTVATRIASYDWPHFAEELDGAGYALLPSLLTPQECAVLAQSYTSDAAFRSLS